MSSDSGDPLYRRSVHVSMGGVFQVPWTRFSAWDSLQVAFQEAGFTSLALALGPDAVELDDPALRQHARVALVMGSEGEGLSEEALAACDYSVVIPMRPGVDSLNVAAAAAVALWELGRGRRALP